MVFSVSENTVKTFDELSWKTSAKYATHDRHIKKDLLEFLGPEGASISFKMAFSVMYGTNPLREVERVNRLVNQGITDRLVIGGRVIGDYKWVIQSASNTLKRFDNKGNCWAAVVSVTMKEYPKR